MPPRRKGSTPLIACKKELVADAPEDASEADLPSTTAASSEPDSSIARENKRARGVPNLVKLVQPDNKSRTSRAQLTPTPTKDKKESKAASSKSEAPKPMSTDYLKVQKHFLKKNGSLVCKRKACLKAYEDHGAWGDFCITTKKQGGRVVVTKDATGDCCFDCDRVYYKGFQDLGSRDEVLIKCNTEPPVEAKFADAKLLLDQEIKPFYPCDVTRNVGSGVRALVRKRGLTADECQEFFKEPHTKSKRTLQNLLSPHTPEKHFQGIVVDDHPELQQQNKGVIYEYCINVSSEKVDYKFLQENQLRGDQADCVWKALTSASQMESQDCKVMRMTVDTVDSIRLEIKNRTVGEEADAERLVAAELRSRAQARKRLDSGEEVEDEDIDDEEHAKLQRRRG